MKKIPVGILGATGMVGQRLISLLEEHPWFEITVLAASVNSAGKLYKDAVSEKWRIDGSLPKKIENMSVKAVEEDMKEIVREVHMVFCALDMDKEKIRVIENEYASRNVAVVSNNSAHRWTEDVPMIIPEVNPKHLELIDVQRKERKWKRGCIVVKPNCSIQSYVAVLTALQEFKPQRIHVISLQAISGAGKTFASWPEMVENINPFISGEEEKSEKEPLKIWGEIKKGKILTADNPKISATCIRVPVSEGHMASVSVKFAKKPTYKQITEAIENFSNPLQGLDLPSAPKRFISFLSDPDRPQLKKDRESEKGMGITMGRLREDTLFDWKFISLAHNTIRGAAGGAVLTAELIVKKGYLV